MCIKASFETKDGITLVSMKNIKNDLNLINNILKEIKSCCAIVDNIFVFPSKGYKTDICFITYDEHVGEILDIISSEKVSISTGNILIKIKPDENKYSNCFTFEIFDLISNYNLDYRFISSFNNEIYMVVSEMNFNEIYNTFLKELKL